MSGKQKRSPFQFRRVLDVIRKDPHLTIEQIRERFDLEERTAVRWRNDALRRIKRERQAHTTHALRPARLP